MPSNGGQKRYYWLRLKDDFFSSKRIKKLRRMAGGDTYTIIYLKMQLLAMKTDGLLKWTGLEEDFADELALDLDEKPDDVKVTLMYLLSCGLAETDDKISYFFPYAVENTGSETSAAQRMREHRARNADVTGVNNVTPMLQDRYVEKEIEIDRKERERDIDTLPRARAYEADDGFDAFWNAYPKKGGDIKACFMEYLHALDTGATPQMLLQAVEAQKREWANTEKRYIPNPERWLENRGWTQETDAPPQQTVNLDELKRYMDKMGGPVEQ